MAKKRITDENFNDVNAVGTRRIDWEMNHAKIKAAMVDLLEELKTVPTTSQLAERAGMRYDTVANHLREMKFEPPKHLARAMTDDVIGAIYKSAMQGNSQAQKLWLQSMEGWRETLEYNHTINTVSDLARLGAEALEAKAKVVEEPKPTTEKE